jgi:ankyrin repeat protein
MAASKGWPAWGWALATAGALAAGYAGWRALSEASPSDEKLRRELLQACRAGNLERVNALLALGVAVDSTDDEEGAPTGLMFASEAGDEKVVRRLLESGADPARQDQTTGLTSLHFAAANGRDEILALLLSASGKVDAPAVNGGTPLMVASLAGHVRCVRRLLARGASVHARRADGATALHLAAHGNHDDVVRELCSCGADVNARMGPQGVTPLMATTRLDNVRAATCLISFGADLETRSRQDSRTALMMAAQHNCTGMISLLLTAGARPDEFDASGMSNALVFASRRGNLEAMRALVRGGCDVNARNARGSTPVMLCCIDGFRESVRELTVLGADLEAMEPLTGFTALMYAAALGHTELVADLLAYRVKPDTRQLAESDASLPPVLLTSQGAASAAGAGPTVEEGSLLSDSLALGSGRTALMWAVAKGHLEVVRTLLERGRANPNVSDVRGNTALDLARCKLPESAVDVTDSVVAPPPPVRTWHARLPTVISERPRVASAPVLAHTQSTISVMSDRTASDLASPPRAPPQPAPGLDLTTDEEVSDESTVEGSHPPAAAATLPLWREICSLLEKAGAVSAADLHELELSRHS